MIDIAIYQRLTSDTAVAAIVSGRVYPMQIPDGIVPQMPYIVYVPSGRNGSRTYDGASKLYSGMVAIECVASSFSAVKALGDAVFNAMESQSWDIAAPVTDPPPDTPADPIGHVQGAFFDDDLSDGIVVGDDENARYIEDQTYLVWVNEA